VAEPEFGERADAPTKPGRKPAAKKTRE
jgi:hypothetical protein